MKYISGNKEFPGMHIIPQSLMEQLFLKQELDYYFKGIKATYLNLLMRINNIYKFDMGVVPELCIIEKGSLNSIPYITIDDTLVNEDNVKTIAEEIGMHVSVLNEKDMK
ncbi:Uncharacterised protein [Candidatus Tiddalikarchaeum anstoanum]|nr:Uncharacterised protein [Candidatus Tiddalikarchaeum anstoanum]